MNLALIEPGGLYRPISAAAPLRLRYLHTHMLIEGLLGAQAISFDPLMKK